MHFSPPPEENGKFYHEKKNWLIRKRAVGIQRGQGDKESIVRGGDRVLNSGILGLGIHLRPFEVQNWKI